MTPNAIIQEDLVSTERYVYMYNGTYFVLRLHFKPRQKKINLLIIVPIHLDEYLDRTVTSALHCLQWTESIGICIDSAATHIHFTQMQLRSLAANTKAMNNVQLIFERLLKQACIRK